MKYFLYKITNTVNAKVYIGITKHLNRRWHGHITPRSKCPKLRNAIRKYGKENFKMVPLCIGSKEYVLDLEKKLIAAYNSINNGYNVHEGGLLFSGDHFLKNSEKLKPVYVRGFWFPDRNTTLSALNISDDVFRRLKREGTLGRLGWDCEYNPKSKPAYVAGFWFVSVKQASDILNISQSSAWRMSKLCGGGLVIDIDIGKENQKRSVSKKIEIFGITYSSIKEASIAIGLSRQTIDRRIKAKHPCFKLF